MDDALDRLAAAAGISGEYHDYFGVRRVVSPETKRALLGAMDFDVSGEGAIEASLHAFEERTWRSRLEPVVVAPEGGPVAVTFAHAASRRGDPHEWRVALEDGSESAGSIVPAELHFLEAREIDGVLFERRSFTIAQALPLGYHTAAVGDGEHTATTTLAIVPPACYLPPRLERDARGAFRRNCTRCARDGIGASATSPIWRPSSRIVADAGGAAIGLNPLHELHLRDPQAASPYSPSSRLLLNPIYLDPRALPGFRPRRRRRGPSWRVCAPPLGRLRRRGPGQAQGVRSVVRAFPAGQSKAARVSRFRPRRRRNAAARCDLRSVDGALRSEGPGSLGLAQLARAIPRSEFRSGDRVRPAERVAGRLLLLPAMAGRRPARGRRRGVAARSARPLSRPRGRRGCATAPTRGRAARPSPPPSPSARRPTRSTSQARTGACRRSVPARVARRARTRRSRSCCARTCATPACCASIT